MLGIPTLCYLVGPAHRWRLNSVPLFAHDLLITEVVPFTKLGSSCATVLNTIDIVILLLPNMQLLTEHLCMLTFRVWQHRGTCVLHFLQWL